MNGIVQKSFYRIVGAVLLALVVAPAAGAAQGEADRDLLKVDVDGILANFEKAQEATRTLTAQFVQKKKVSLLGETLTSSGRIYYTKPDKVLWLHEKPDPRVICIDGDVFTNWYKDLKRASVVDISKQRKRVFKYFAIGEKIDVLKEHFIVTVAARSDVPGTVRLELLPRRQRVRDRMDRMEMWISKTSWLPVQIRYSEPGGDFTQYTFTDVKANAVIPDATYGVHLPPDVKVDRTFGGMEPDAAPTRRQ